MRHEPLPRLPVRSLRYYGLPGTLELRALEPAARLVSYRVGYRHRRRLFDDSAGLGDLLVAEAIRAGVPEVVLVVFCIYL